MSTHQQTKPCFANQSITDESARPGTTRSNVGCDAIDEPCTNSTAGLSSGAPAYFSHRKSRTAPLCAQCSVPVTISLTCRDFLKQIVGLCPRFASNQLFESAHRVVILPQRIPQELGFAA